MIELALVALSWTAALNAECKPTISADVAIIGVASDPDDGKTLYCEWHTYRDAEGVKNVYYADTRGKVFARKKLDLSQDPSRPSYEQVDERFGESHKVSRNENTFIFEYQEDENADLQRVEISSKKVDVIDAGFDQKIRDLWLDISKKENQKIDFGSTVFQRSLALRVRESDVQACPLNAYFKQQGQATRCFIIEPASFFVRLFFDGLKLSYDSESKQLLQFFGPVNIKSPEGGKLKALIRYVYAPKEMP